MPLPDIFSQSVTDSLVSRINKLDTNSNPLWGKMDVAQMLAHCNVTYELTYETMHPRPNAFMRFILKTFLKKIVVGEKAFKKNSPTSPVFKKVEEENFVKQKARLLAYLQTTVEKGRVYFEGKENLSFGKLTANEWNNLFYKHLNHHLEQFGV